MEMILNLFLIEPRNTLIQIEDNAVLCGVQAEDAIGQVELLVLSSTTSTLWLKFQGSTVHAISELYGDDKERHE